MSCGLSLFMPCGWPATMSTSVSNATADWTGLGKSFRSSVPLRIFEMLSPMLLPPKMQNKGKSWHTQKKKNTNKKRRTQKHETNFKHADATAWRRDAAADKDTRTHIYKSTQQFQVHSYFIQLFAFHFTAHNMEEQQRPGQWQKASFKRCPGDQIQLFY